MRGRRVVLAVLLAGAAMAGWSVPGIAQQQPLSPVRETGQTVTPAFEGSYPNGDGTFSVSFGYFNRNSKEVVEIPIGAVDFLYVVQATRRFDEFTEIVKRHMWIHLPVYLDSQPEC